jgi:hypothetical protein
MMGTPADIFATEVWKIMSPNAKKITLISFGILAVIGLCLDYNDKRKTEPDFKWWKYLRGNYMSKDILVEKPSPPLPKINIKHIILPVLIPMLFCFVLWVLIEIAGK